MNVHCGSLHISLAILGSPLVIIPEAKSPKDGLLDSFRLFKPPCIPPKVALSDTKGLPGAPDAIDCICFAIEDPPKLLPTPYVVKAAASFAVDPIILAAPPNKLEPIKVVCNDCKAEETLKSEPINCDIPLGAFSTANKVPIKANIFAIPVILVPVVAPELPGIVVVSCNK